MPIGALNWKGLAAVSARLELQAGKGLASRIAPDDPDLKRLQNIQDALQRLDAMPSRKIGGKQAAMDRIGMLRQRLDEMKSLLLYATPQMAKALAKELKSVAKELAAIAGSGVSVPSGADAGQAQAAASQAESVSETQAASGQADASSATAASADTSSGQAVDSSGKPGSVDSSGTAQEGDTKVLQALLMDARKLLKEVVGMLKPKLAQAGKEARQDMQAAEKYVSDLDHALVSGQGAGDALYTALGGLSGDAAAPLAGVSLSA